MTETTKTLAFLAAGGVAIAGAMLLDSRAATSNVQQLVGQMLTKEIELDEPRRLQIVRFDQQTGEARKFEVAHVDGVWSIPSKNNYPADATEQMAAAVTSLMNRKILRIADETAQSHAKYGVVDPLSPNLDIKSVGIGTRVTMSDAKDDTLVDVIVGTKANADEAASAMSRTGAEQRYVRRANQDVVYVVEIDPTKLSTSFSDWIEGNLLQLTSSDARKVYINDYTAQLGLDPQTMQPTVSMMPQGEITLARGAEADAKWTVAALRKADLAAQRIVDDAVAADEEVNQTAITDLLTGLEDLAIADVERKPEGLSADLKAGEAFMSNEEAITDLMEKGFIPGRQQSGADMLSSEGELVVTQRNGVEYVLRFGRLKVTDDEGDAGDAQESEGAEGAAAERPENLRRYLFVMANFKEDAVEKPVYKDLPALPAEAAASAPDAEEAPAGSETPSGAAAGAGADEAAAGSEAAAEEDSAGDDAEADDAAEDDGQPQAQSEEETGAEDDPATGADPGTPAAGAAQEPQGQDAEAADADAAGQDADAQDAAGQGAEGPNAEEPAQEPSREAIIAEREAIEQENEQARADYEALISEGREQATALNERFGDWYFVISNETFKKIHIGRAQVITKKAPPEAAGQEAGAGASLPGMPNLGAPVPGGQP